jgi:hypothetical protein
MKRREVYLIIFLVVLVALISSVIAGYACTLKMAEEYIVYCPQTPEAGKNCSNYYWELHAERWGCSPEEGNGVCSGGSFKIRYIDGKCTADQNGNCKPAGDVDSYAMRACS